MANKGRRKHAKPNKRTKVRPSSSKKTWISIKEFISKHFVALLSIVMSMCTSFAIYYLAYSEPDIRSVASPDGAFKTSISSPIEDKGGDCFYYTTAILKFKNLSLKSGYIDKVTFVPINENMIPEFKLIDVSRSKLGWGEEREIEVKYSAALSPDVCTQMDERNEALVFELRFYDNTGKLIDKDSDGNPFHAMSKILPAE
jgi:hypothetical protein